MTLNQILDRCEKSPLISWARGDAHVKSEPWLVYISLTNACNHKCIFCAQPTAMRDDKGIMSMEIFTRIVDQLPQSVLKVYLMKQGESFINKKLEDMAEYLKSKRPDVNISLHTNCVLATKERVKRLFKSIDSLGISIDSITPDLYHSIHKKDDFEVVTKNMKDISDLLLEMPKEKRPHIFVDYIHIKANQHEKEEDVQAFVSNNFPGFGSLDFHWENNYQGEIEEANLEIYNKIDEENFPRCVFPWSSITFLYDGKIDYCFVEPREDVFLGDILTQSFDEIWNGEPYVNFRKKVAENKYHSLSKDDKIQCNKCTWLWQPKVQSPKNLAGGYARQARDDLNTLQFGDILEMGDEEALSVAVEYLLGGETHRAIGIVQHILTVTNEAAVMQACQKILTMAQTVLTRYKDLRLWQQKMAEESQTNKTFEERLHQNFKNKYVAINAG